MQIWYNGHDNNVGYWENNREYINHNGYIKKMLQADPTKSNIDNASIQDMIALLK